MRLQNIFRDTDSCTEKYFQDIKRYKQGMVFQIARIGFCSPHKLSGTFFVGVACFEYFFSIWRQAATAKLISAAA